MVKKIVKHLFPKSVIQFILYFKIKFIDGYATNSYSQEGEDMILRRIFGNQKNGFYVDVGAHHPKRFSNTYYFYKKGWRGINIDAMPGSMKAFDKIRRRDVNIEKPISDQKQLLTYFAFNEPALNGFSRELTNERISKSSPFHLIFEKNIETATLSEILDLYMPKNQEIDFLAIDVEGLDFQVLKSNNFLKYKPKVIVIEILGKNLEELINNEITIYLKKFGYVIYSKSINSTIFVSDFFINSFN